MILVGVIHSGGRYGFWFLKLVLVLSFAVFNIIGAHAVFNTTTIKTNDLGRILLKEKLLRYVSFS